MRISRLELELLDKRYKALKELWHAKISYLRYCCDDNKTSFIQRAWLRLYIMNIKRELEYILFRMGRLHRYQVGDWCGTYLDKDV